MAKTALHNIDIRYLQYFSVVAEEKSLSRAAERLLLSQPPLSLHIKNLEEQLGVTLFLRHSKGVSLTEDGMEVLRLIRPLLELHDKTLERLGGLSTSGNKSFSFGLSTGFEQGSFVAVVARVRAVFGENVRIVRDASRPLVEAIKRGKLDTALIALPLFNTEGLVVKPLPYAEARVLALPAAWAGVDTARLSLSTFSGKPLFRLRRDHNPGFFELTKKIFSHAGFSSPNIEEPLAHDVTLALIASGEGMGLFPVSFTALTREGVVYRPFIESNLLECRLAAASLPEKETLLKTILHEIEPVLPPSKML